VRKRGRFEGVQVYCLVVFSGILIRLDTCRVTTWRALSKHCSFLSAEAENFSLKINRLPKFLLLFIDPQTEDTMSNSTCTVLSCQDSALSTAASVVGLLTFAGGVFVGLMVRSRLIKNSTAELHALMGDAESATRQIHRLRVRLEIYSTEQPDDRDVDDLKQLMEQATRIVREIEYRMNSLKAYDHYSKWEATKLSMKGVVKQAELTGSVKKAQSLLRELQLGMMQL